MADIKEDIEKEKLAEAPKASPKAPTEAPEGLSEKRGEIAGAISEGVEEAEEEVTGAEKVTEVSTERPGEARPVAKKKKKKPKKKDEGKAAAAAFTFDEKNLPPAPKMIQMIEKQLRSEISYLYKEARRHKAGVFRSGDLHKYNNAVSEIRKKNVLLKRLFTMAADALKKLFTQLFKPSKAT